jgi:plasmid stabilization system protein ParE
MTASARNELDGIVIYIAKDAPFSALDFLEEVLATADMLVTLAKRGRMVPELQDATFFWLSLRGGFVYGRALT